MEYEFVRRDRALYISDGLFPQKTGLISFIDIGLLIY